MFEKMEKMAEIINDVIEKTSDFEEYEFMTIMSMLFDEFHRTHENDMSSVEMAKMVASSVEFVNKSLGEYV